MQDLILNPMRAEKYKQKTKKRTPMINSVIF